MSAVALLPALPCDVAIAAVRHAAAPERLLPAVPFMDMLLGSFSCECTIGARCQRGGKAVNHQRTGADTAADV
jgi:hypothetical protein